MGSSLGILGSNSRVADLRHRGCELKGGGGVKCHRDRQARHHAIEINLEGNGDSAERLPGLRAYLKPAGTALAGTTTLQVSKSIS